MKWGRFGVQTRFRNVTIVKLLLNSKPLVRELWPKKHKSFSGLRLKMEWGLLHTTTNKGRLCQISIFENSKGLRGTELPGWINFISFIWSVHFT